MRRIMGLSGGLSPPFLNDVLFIFDKASLPRRIVCHIVRYTSIDYTVAALPESEKLKPLPRSSNDFIPGSKSNLPSRRP